MVRGLGSGGGAGGLGLKWGVVRGLGLGFGFGRRFWGNSCLERLSWAARSLRRVLGLGLCWRFWTQERRKSRGKVLCLVPWVLKVG